MELKHIKGLPGFSVSDSGKVFHNGKELSTYTAQHDSIVVRITRDGWSKNFSVARLVLTAFSGLPPRGCKKLRHKDGDPTNNAIRNLEWIVPNNRNIVSVILDSADDALYLEKLGGGNMGEGFRLVLRFYKKHHKLA